MGNTVNKAKLVAPWLVSKTQRVRDLISAIRSYMRFASPQRRQELMEQQRMAAQELKETEEKIKAKIKKEFREKEIQETTKKHGTEIAETEEEYRE
jgi:predicted small metal-binding protein